MSTTEVKNEYVNNQQFLAALIEYNKKKIDAENSGSTPPRMSNYLGQCIQLIATRLSYNKNFVNYMFREDMVGDGIENGIRAVDSFDPEKSNNPFGYFTRVIYFAFLRRIEKEKKELYTKFKRLESMGTIGDENGSDTTEFNTQLGGDNDYRDEFIRKYETKLKEKKLKAKDRSDERKGIEKYANTTDFQYEE